MDGFPDAASWGAPNNGYSYPAPVDTEYRGDITLDKGMYGNVQWTEPAAARQFILDTLKAQGITLKEDGE